MFFSLNFQIFLQKNDLFRHFLSFLSIRGNLNGLYRRLVLDVQMPCTGCTDALYWQYKRFVLSVQTIGTGSGTIAKSKSNEK